MNPTFRTNDIVDYLVGNEFRLGTVHDSTESRIQVRGAKGETAKIAFRQVLCVLPFHNREEAKNAIDAGRGEVEPAYLWEMISEKGKEYSFEELSQEYYGDASPLHLSILARALAEDPVHFQRKEMRILVHTGEEAEEIARLRALRAERAARRERTIVWMNQALACPADAPEPFPVPEEQESFVRGTLDYLMLGSNTEAVNLLATARPGVTARSAGLRLLRAIRRLPEDADEFLLSNGIHAGFPKEVLEEAENLPGTFAREERKNWPEEYIFSVDDPETREIDDAISCRKSGENYEVGIYIADPAEFVRRDGELDRCAADRPLSLYLPTTTVMMFPNTLSCNIASLNEGTPRPVLAFHCTISEEGEVLDWNLTPGWISVTRHMTYGEMENILADEKSADPAAEPGRILLFLADKLRKGREEAGAVILQRPELRIHVTDHGKEIRIDMEDQESPARRMIGEFMVLCNHLAAKFALRNEIPVIYRVQDPPDRGQEAHSVRPYDAYRFEQEVRKMKRTRLSTYPDGHYGLGLDLYVQISSPLRRYADLVIHRQIAAVCKGNPPPYTQEELFVILDNVERTAFRNRSLERGAKSYWVHEYLRRNCCNQTMMATIVKVEGTLILAELDNYCVKGILSIREPVRPGEHLPVKILQVNPENERIQLMQAE